MYRVVSFEILNDVVRTQFVTTPKMVLGSYVKGPNNIICRAWAERLGLGHRTVVRHGFHSTLHKGEPDVSNNTLFRYVLSSSDP